MSKFKVVMEETCVYHVEVEAKDEGDAERAAEEAFTQAEDSNAFFVSVQDRYAIAVEAVTDGPVEGSGGDEVEEADGVPDHT